MVVPPKFERCRLQGLARFLKRLAVTLQVVRIDSIDQQRWIVPDIFGFETADLTNALAHEREGDTAIGVEDALVDHPGYVGHEGAQSLLAFVPCAIRKFLMGDVLRNPK